MIRRVPRELAQGKPQLSLSAVVVQRWIDEHRPPPGSSPPLDITAVTRALTALVGEELALRPEHIRAIVEREVSVVRRAQVIELRVHPEDRALLEDVPDYQSKLELAGQLTVTSDSSIERGGCLVISNLGELDARLPTRIQVAAELLHNGGFGAR